MLSYENRANSNYLLTIKVEENTKLLLLVHQWDAL